MSWEIDLLELQWRHFSMGMELIFLTASVAWHLAALPPEKPRRRFVLIQGDKR